MAFRETFSCLPWEWPGDGDEEESQRKRKSCLEAIRLDVSEKFTDEQLLEIKGILDAVAEQRGLPNSAASLPRTPPTARKEVQVKVEPGTEVEAAKEANGTEEDDLWGDFSQEEWREVDKMVAAAYRKKGEGGRVGGPVEATAATAGQVARGAAIADVLG